jgi:hypothetical protein
MANTYEIIAKVNVGSGGTANIELTSIPSTYTDLKLVVSDRSNRSGGNDAFFVYFNNSTSGYSGKRLFGNGNGSVTSDTSTGIIDDGNTATANTFSNIEIYIPNYAGSNNKSFSADAIQEDNQSNAYASFNAILWSNTASITSIKLVPETGTGFVEHSTAYLYGIKNS